MKHERVDVNQKWTNPSLSDAVEAYLHNCEFRSMNSLWPLNARIDCIPLDSQLVKGIIDWRDFSIEIYKTGLTTLTSGSTKDFSNLLGFAEPAD
jgi:hypothetical protein